MKRSTFGFKAVKVSKYGYKFQAVFFVGSRNGDLQCKSIPFLELASRHQLITLGYLPDRIVRRKLEQE